MIPEFVVWMIYIPVSFCIFAKCEFPRSIFVKFIGFWKNTETNLIKRRRLQCLQSFFFQGVILMNQRIYGSSKRNVGVSVFVDKMAALCVYHSVLRGCSTFFLSFCFYGTCDFPGVDSGFARKKTYFIGSVSIIKSLTD